MPEDSFILYITIIMGMRKLSENINLAIGFISGIIFSNAVGALFQGQFVITILSFAAVVVAIFLKKFVDWGVEE